MVVDYIKFKKSPLNSSVSLYLIHGNPRNISNEIEHDIVYFYKKLEYSHLNYVVEDDSQLDIIQTELYGQSLFNEKKIFTLNITSKSIPAGIKDLILKENDSSKDVMIIKLDRQPSSFKNTKFYKLLSKHQEIIEIYELKGNVLEEWVKRKCELNNLQFDSKYIRSLITSNQNNSFAISQSIYQRGCIQDNSDYTTSNDSKYSEYDLVDSFLSKDLIKFRSISHYLQYVNTPLPYLIFLLNSELEKLYSLKCDLDPKPYIPNFLYHKYNSACIKYDTTQLLIGLEGIYKLDADSKYNSSKVNPWIRFNDFFVNIMNNNE